MSDERAERLKAYAEWKPGGMYDYAQQEIDRLSSNLNEMEHIFEIRWQASQRAIEKWHAAGGPELVWPDHADLCVWLLEQLAERESKLEQREELLATAYQLAGLVGAPVRFLDAYGLHDETANIESLLPVDLTELDEFEALQSKLDMSETAVAECHAEIKRLECRLGECEDRFQAGRDAWELLEKSVPNLNELPGARAMRDALTGITLVVERLTPPPGLSTTSGPIDILSLCSKCGKFLGHGHECE